jgi:hypothetical protein
MSIVEILDEIRKTNITKTIHSEPYDAVSPTRPELSQAGRTVLITGGGTGAGFAMARAFIQASASTIVIIGRRAEVLETARLKLEDEVKSTGMATKIIVRPCDGTSVLDIDALWLYLSEQNITVDVYVANAAKFTEPTPMMELGTEEVWSQFQTNLWSPLYFTEKFYKQPGDKPKVSKSYSFRDYENIPEDVSYTNHAIHAVYSECDNGEHPRYATPCGGYACRIHGVQVCRHPVFPVSRPRLPSRESSDHQLPPRTNLQRVLEVPGN